MAKKEATEKKSNGLKALFVVVGAVITIGTFLAVLYGIFKKYFKISIECGDECDDAFDDDFDDFDFEPSREDCCGCEPDVTLAEDAEIYDSDKDDEDGEAEEGE